MNKDKFELVNINVPNKLQQFIDVIHTALLVIACCSFNESFLGVSALKGVKLLVRKTPSPFT